MVGSFRTGQENLKTQKGEEGVGWSFLYVTLAYVFTLNEMVFYPLNERSTKVKGQG